MENNNRIKELEGLHIVIHFGLFIITMIYMEFILRISTEGTMKSMGSIYTIGFSMIYGILFYYITTIGKNKMVQYIWRSILLLLLAVPYCVVYFSYYEFRVFYDLKTTFAGAGDAVGSFSGDIISMVFSVDGMIHLLLFLLPFIIYLMIGRKIDAYEKICKHERLVMCIILFFVLSVNSLLIMTNEKAKNIMGAEYNYSTALNEFGMITGIGLDAKQNIFGNHSDSGFELGNVTEHMTTEEKETATQAGETTDEITEATTEEYGQNILTIDFDALSKDASEEVASMDAYVSSLKASSKNEYTGLFKGKNLIFFTAEAFTAEAIDPELTPTLYRLANRGINFTDYYQPASAGTTGGEYNNLMGLLPTEGGGSMKRTAKNLNCMTIASHLSEQGYYGKAYHNNSYSYYDRDKTHITLGYSDGYEGVGNGLEECITEQWPESDLEMLKGTLRSYIRKDKFDIYYMTVSGHSLYSKDGNAMTRKHWDQVKDLPYSDTVKSYLGAQLELEDALTYLVDQLEMAGIADDTVIVISADHFPYGLDQDSNSMKYLSELYGKKIDNTLERDHNRLIIWSGCLEKEDPIVVDSPVCSIDVLPTLLNMFGAEYDSRLLPGRDVFSDAEPLVFDLGYDWKTDLGTYISATGHFTPKDDSVTIPDGYVDEIKKTVKNKISYCKGVLKNDYYRHIYEQ